MCTKPAYIGSNGKHPEPAAEVPPGRTAAGGWARGAGGGPAAADPSGPRHPFLGEADPADGADEAGRPAGHWRQGVIAAAAVAAIAAHLLLRHAAGVDGAAARLPLLAALVGGGLPLLYDLAAGIVRGRFGSDLLAGMSILTSVVLGEYLAGTLVVLMLSGGQALEAYAVRSASSVLRALARRVPSTAHRKDGAAVADVPLGDVRVGDALVVFPHEFCPVDGVVVDGHGVMDESYLTGEPFRMSKAPGSEVLSGAVNGETAMTVRATRVAADSRYAKIVRVMRASEKDAPRMRRLGDQLGAYYTPLAVAVAVAAGWAAGSADRFLAVLVVATPCPLLIAIPVAVIGSISLCARRGIIVKRPAVLEQVSGCRTLIFDKTGTLTYGEPRLTDLAVAPGFDRDQVLSLTAGLERYSKHPLARAVLAAADAAGLAPPPAAEISERPGEGLRGTVGGRAVRVTGRGKALAADPGLAGRLPPAGGGGLECVVLVDDAYAGTFRFRDEPRAEGASFVRHLPLRHHVDRLLLVSGDRESEVRHLAGRVGIREVFAGQAPEEKLEIVRRETRRTKTLYLGDGINDAPALLAATVGVALGQNSDITTEAAGAVIMDSSLTKVDEFLHVSGRMRRIALQSAVGGMALSLVGMAFAAAGHLSPVAGAVAQEVIDVLAVANAMRASVLPRALSDF